MKEHKIPMRKCVGCSTSKPKNELIRISYYDNKLILDETGRAKGRGIYLCKDNSMCVEIAKKRKAIERSFPDAHKEEIYNILERLINE